MADHDELVAELSAVEKMPTGERLKHARKKRAQQLKKYTQYEKQLDKETGKKMVASNKKHIKNMAPKRRSNLKVKFVNNVVLLEAAARNDIEEVRMLLKQGICPDACNDDGLTALHQCCIDDSQEMVELLVEHGANVDARDSELWTPLHAAATCAHLQLCRFLIEHNANLLAVNADGNMPYDICEDEATLDYIESEMARRGVTQEMIDELRLSREKMMLDDLQKLVQEGCDLEYHGRQGETPLHIAAANGYIQVAEFLLSHDVSVDCVDNDSWQPIHCAACWGQLPVLELLLEHGASLDAKTKHGDTPLDICEDEDLKQRIDEIRQAIETSRLAKSRELSRRRSTNVRSASVRRTSMREKNALSWKDAREEAQKLRESVAMSHPSEEEDEEGRTNSAAVTSSNLLAAPGKHNSFTESPCITTNDIKVIIPDNNRKSADGRPVSSIGYSDAKVTSSKSENGQAAALAAADYKPMAASHQEHDCKSSSALDVTPPVDGRTGSSPSVDRGPTLAELKRQRAGARESTQPRLSENPTEASRSSGNGGVVTPNDDERPKLRLVSSVDVVGPSEKESGRCCIII